MVVSCFRVFSATRSANPYVSTPAARPGAIKPSFDQRSSWRARIPSMRTTSVRVNFCCIGKGSQQAPGEPPPCRAKTRRGLSLPQSIGRNASLQREFSTRAAWLCPAVARRNVYEDVELICQAGTKHLSRGFYVNHSSNLALAVFTRELSSPTFNEKCQTLSPRQGPPDNVYILLTSAPRRCSISRIGGSIL